VECWSRPDPSALGVSVPQGVRRHFPGFERALQRYGDQLYSIAKVPRDDARADLARQVVQAFFDLYAYERNWKALKDSRP